jgi:hypothetical protein
VVASRPCELAWSTVSSSPEKKCRVIDPKALRARDPSGP